MSLTTLPLRDVPGRLTVLVTVVDEANLELARAVGMAMGSGYKELQDKLIAVGKTYLRVEHELAGWRMALRPEAGEAFREEER